MQSKTNAELLQLITDAAAELERRRQQNEGSQRDGEEDEGEGGDHPPDPKFP